MIRLHLFGAPVLRGPEPITGPAAQRQRLALLALLALGRDAGVSRDRLVALLWPEADTERGRHLLANSVYVIRRGLGGDVIRSRGDVLYLDPACIGTDVGDFLDALDRGDDAGAAACCGEPFLDGFFLPEADEFERWVAAERDRLARACHAALERLGEAAEAAHDFRAAAGWWRRLTLADPYSSRALLRLMRALAAAGEPAVAIRHARQHERRLRDDLDLPLPPEVAAEVARLSAAAPTPGTAPSADPVARLHEPAAQPGNRGVADDSPATAGLPLHDSPAPDERVPSTPAPELAGPAVAARGRRRGVVLAGSALLPLLLVAVLGREMLAPRGGAAAAPAQSIAVLPFVNLSADVDDEYFSDGLTEDLLNHLAGVPGLRVAARSSAFSFKGSGVDVTEIARRLNVAMVLEGTVRRSGERVRVTARLVNVADGYQAWTRTYDQSASDMMQIQDGIAREIVASVLPRVARSDDAVLRAHSTTTDVIAYEEYLRGRYLFWQGGGEANLRAAIRHYENAIARDSTYALAWAGLADAWMLMPGTPDETMPRAKDAALRALRLDDELPQGYVALASINWFYDRDWDAAAQNYRRSFSVDRVVYTRCICYVWYLAALGDLESAEREAQRARALDPVSTLPAITLAQVQLMRGHVERLGAMIDTLRTLAAGEGSLTYLETWRLWDGGRHDEAVQLMERHWGDARAAADSALPGEIAMRAYMYAHTDRNGDARMLAEALRERARTQHVPPHILAATYAAAGDDEEASRWIRAAYDRRYNLAYFSLLPESRALRSLAAYDEVLRRIGMPGVE